MVEARLRVDVRRLHLRHQSSEHLEGLHFAELSVQVAVEEAI